MSAPLQIAGLWLGFAATHIALSSQPVRPRLTRLLGERLYLGVYSLIALAFFVPLVGTYFSNKHVGPVLWQLPLGPVLRWGIYLSMGVAFTMVVASLVRPSPAVPFGLGKAEIQGMSRITRHPLVMGVVLFGLLHLVPNGGAADVVFFAGFVGFGLVGAWHQDRRKLASGDEAFRRFHANTPFVPFTGRESLRGLRELSPFVWTTGIALTVIVRYFHAAWFLG